MVTASEDGHLTVKLPNQPTWRRWLLAFFILISLLSAWSIWVTGFAHWLSAPRSDAPVTMTAGSVPNPTDAYVYSAHRGQADVDTVYFSPDGVYQFARFPGDTLRGGCAILTSLPSGACVVTVLSDSVRQRGGPRLVYQTNVAWFGQSAAPVLIRLTDLESNRSLAYVSSDGDLVLAGWLFDAATDVQARRVTIEAN